MRHRAALPHLGAGVGAACRDSQWRRAAMTAGRRASLHDSERHGGGHRLKPALRRTSWAGAEQSPMPRAGNPPPAASGLKRCPLLWRRSRVPAGRDLHHRMIREGAGWRTSKSALTDHRDSQKSGELGIEVEASPDHQPGRRVGIDQRVKYGRATTSNCCRSAASDLSRPARRSTRSAAIPGMDFCLFAALTRTLVSRTTRIQHAARLPSALA